MDKAGKIALLLDFYGSLLTERQAEMLDLHCNEDQSLSEIAEHFGVSRQSVHDAVRIGADALLMYEARLGLAAAHERERELFLAIIAAADALAAALQGAVGAAEAADAVKVAGAAEAAGSVKVAGAAEAADAVKAVGAAEAADAVKVAGAAEAADVATLAGLASRISQLAREGVNEAD